LEKKLVKHQYLPICPHNIMNFGLIAAEIDLVVWAPLQISTGLTSWQPYCTALEYWASATLCGVEQRAPPIFCRAAITLGIGPISSCFSFLHYYFCLVPCGRLSWLCQLLGARKYSASYRIVSNDASMFQTSGGTRSRAPFVQVSIARFTDSLPTCQLADSEVHSPELTN